MVPAAQPVVDPKGAKDRNQTEATASVKNVMPAVEPQKTSPAQKESAFTIEPIKTRQIQSAEECNLNTTVQPTPTPAVTRSEVGGETELAAVRMLSAKEHKTELKEEKTDFCESPMEKNNPTEARTELKEVSTSVVQPDEESKEDRSEPSVTSEPVKRRSLSELEGELTPQKRPRMSSVSSVSSVSSISPPASSTSSPPTPTLATNQRVPPLKVGIFVNLKVSSDLSCLLNIKGTLLVDLKGDYDKLVIFNLQSVQKQVVVENVSQIILSAIDPYICVFQTRALKSINVLL